MTWSEIIFDFGEMAEWSNAAVLKTVDLNGSGGSNPSLSAIKDLNCFVNQTVKVFFYPKKLHQNCTGSLFSAQGENPVFRITKKYVPLNR